MNIYVKYPLAFALASTVVACGGGNGGLVGIGGSGYIATGTVTGFGSVYVNGVQFNTDAAVYEIEDAAGSQSNLSIGMVVQVEGTINSDGISGTATGIRYGDQLQGPVAAISGESSIVTNADGNQKSFSVLGTTVIIDSSETVFDGTGFNFDSIALNNAVEISGHYDNNQQLRATYVELKALVFDATSNVEIEGFIKDLNNFQFTVRNVNVNASNASLSDFDDGLSNDVYVEVKGTYDSNTNTINAVEVEVENISYVDTDEVSIEGYITRYVSNSDFDVNGIAVNAGNATLEPATLVLMNGIKIEVEGTFSNNILLATEVESEDGQAKAFATVTAIDTTNSQFTVDADADPGIVQPITIRINASTTMEDDVGENEPFLLSQLAVTDYVEVTGFESGSNSIDAIKVKRVNPTGKPGLLQGTASSTSGGPYPSAGTITILNVAYDFDGSTVFENESEVSMSSTEINDLLSGISSTLPVLKIKDEDNDGTADEIDIE